MGGSVLSAPLPKLDQQIMNKNTRDGMTPESYIYYRFVLMPTCIEEVVRAYDKERPTRGNDGKKPQQNESITRVR